MTQTLFMWYFPFLTSKKNSHLFFHLEISEWYFFSYNQKKLNIELFISTPSSESCSSISPWKHCHIAFRYNIHGIFLWIDKKFSNKYEKASVVFFFFFHPRKIIVIKIWRHQPLPFSFSIQTSVCVYGDMIFANKVMERNNPPFKAPISLPHPYISVLRSSFTLCKQRKDRIHKKKCIDSYEKLGKHVDE